MNFTDNHFQQLAWFIAFIGSIIATAEEKSNDQFPNYAWFAIAYMLCVIIGIFVVIASDTTQTYHVAIVGYLACGLVLTSSSVNATIYSSNGAREATAAGHILLSMVNVSSLLCSCGNMLIKPDCMDLLLWISTFRRTPRIP